MKVRSNLVIAIAPTAVLIAAVLFIGGCASTSSINKTGNRTVDAVLETAEQHLGTSYCSAGNTPDCFDCSGFVYYCFSAAHVSVPRTTSELFKFGSAISFEDLKPGDLVFYNTTGKGVSHVGIFIGDGKFIHSSTTKGVMISPLDDQYWNPRFLGSRRVVSSRR